MPNKRDRLIHNEATTFAHSHSRDIEEERIWHLEKLRNILELDKKDIDQNLDKSSNWYASNTKGDGTHRLSRTDYLSVKDYLEIEYLRDIAGVNENVVSSALNQSRGWYQECLKTGFKIHQYSSVFAFLSAVIILLYEVDEIPESQFREPVDLGVISQKFFKETMDSVNIDYPAR